MNNDNDMTDSNNKDLLWRGDLFYSY